MTRIKGCTPAGIGIDAVKRILLLSDQSLHSVVSVIPVKRSSGKYHIQLKSHKQQKDKKIQLVFKTIGFQAFPVNRHKPVAFFVLFQCCYHAERRKQKRCCRKNIGKQTKAVIDHCDGNRNADQLKQCKHDKIAGHKNTSGGSVLLFHQHGRQKPHAKGDQYQPQNQTGYL